MNPALKSAQCKIQVIYLILGFVYCSAKVTLDSEQSPYQLVDSSSAVVEGDPLYCYQCHSDRDPYCEIISANSSDYYKPCVSPDPTLPSLCRKIVQKIYQRANQRLVLRRCGWIQHKDECYRLRNYVHTETVCQCFTDGCNHGNQHLSVSTSTAVLAASSLAVSIIML